MKSLFFARLFHPFALVIAAIALALMGAAAQAQPAQDADAAARDYASAAGLLNRGLNDLAVQEYRKFLAAHADHEKAALARYGLGIALFRLRQFDEAQVELARLAEIKGFQFAGEAWFVRGQCLMATGKYADAAAALKRVVGDYSTNDRAGDACALLVESLYRAGQHADARSACATMAERWPEHPRLERAGFFSSLAAVAMTDHVGAVHDLETLLARFPQGEFANQATLLLAQSFHRSGDLDRAARQYEAVIKQDKPDTTPDALYGLAIVRHAQSQLEKAANALDEFLKKFPTHHLVPSALLLRGRIWFAEEQYGNAQASFEKALAGGAPADEAGYWRAKCLLRRGEFAKAAAELDRLARDHATSEFGPEIMYDRGIALYRAGDAAQAADVLERFASTYPKHAQVADALQLRAMIEHARQNYAKSRTLCETFLKSFANHPQAAEMQFLAAENDLLSGNAKAAIDEYRHYLSEAPSASRSELARFRLGSALYREGRLDEALSTLSQIAAGSHTPQDYRGALLLIGDIQFSRSAWTEAASSLGDYLSFGLDQPSADDALLKLGLAQLRMSQAAEAMETFDQLIAKFPESPTCVQAHFERGQILLVQKQWANAETAFGNVLKDGADSRFAAYATYHLAAIAMQRNEFEHAAELYGKVAASSIEKDTATDATFRQGEALIAAKRFDDAAGIFEEFVRLSPDHERAPMARVQYAIALARAGQPEESLKAIESLEKSDLRNLDAPSAATLLYEKAWCLRDLRRDEEAPLAYRELITKFPRLSLAASAMLELAELESTAKRHAEAVSLLEQFQAAAADPTIDIPAASKEQALYRLAAERLEIGKFAEAASAAEEFIDHYPTSTLLPSAHLLCGEALFKSGSPSKASQHFAAVVENCENNPNCAAALLRLGECQAADQQWAKSEKTFAEYLQRFADGELWFQAQFGLGWARENLGRFDDALNAYRKVVERHAGPTAARSQFQIGECLFAQKKYEEAVRELLKVDILYAYPEWSAAAIYEAGRCFEQLTKPAEARSQFEQVQNRFPQSNWAQLARERLTATASQTSSSG